MSEILSKDEITISIALKLTETEARALEAIAGYNVDDFLKVFYQHIGKHYLQPHEKDLASLFETIKKELPKHLNKADKTRELWKQ